MAPVLMVIAPERFRDEELFETRAALERAGHDIVIASSRVGACPGSRGGTAHAQKTLSSCSASDYGAIVFVGGGGSKLLWDDPDAHRLAREAVSSGLVVGAICLAPVILARAGVLSGLRATVAGTEASALEDAGATYTGPGVTADGLIVTANGPKSSAAFGEQIVALLEAVRGQA